MIVAQIQRTANWRAPSSDKLQGAVDKCGEL